MQVEVEQRFRRIFEVREQALVQVLVLVMLQASMQATCVCVLVLALAIVLALVQHSNVCMQYMHLLEVHRNQKALEIAFRRNIDHEN